MFHRSQLKFEDGGIAYVLKLQEKVGQLLLLMNHYLFRTTGYFEVLRQHPQYTSRQEYFSGMKMTLYRITHYFSIIQPVLS